MKAHYLPSSFVVQSQDGALFIAAADRHSGGYSLLVESQRYPQTGVVRIDGLQPGRYYLLDGAAHRFARADPAGVATVELRLTAPALVTLTPLI